MNQHLVKSEFHRTNLLKTIEMLDARQCWLLRQALFTHKGLYAIAGIVGVMPRESMQTYNAPRLRRFGRPVATPT